MNKLAIINSYSDLAQIADAMAKSGYFQDSKTAAQAMVKIMAGQEIGLGTFASMSGIHIVSGKPTLGSNIVATLIENDIRYDYEVIEATDKKCVIHFLKSDKVRGTVSITIEEAQKANMHMQYKDGVWKEKTTWKNFPSDMLFARCITRGARRYTPGIFGGAPVYTPEELGADVDEDGNVVTVDVTIEDPESEPETTSKKKPEKPLPELKKSNGRPWSPDKLREMLAKKAATYPADHNVLAPARKQLAAVIGQLATPAKRKLVNVALGMLEHTEMSDQRLVQATIDWLGFEWNKDEKTFTFKTVEAVQEMALIVASLPVDEVATAELGYE